MANDKNQNYNSKLIELQSQIDTLKYKNLELQRQLREAQNNNSLIQHMLASARARSAQRRRQMKKLQKGTEVGTISNCYDIASRFCALASCSCYNLRKFLCTG